jgi:hypothetical protein
MYDDIEYLLYLLQILDVFILLRQLEWSAIEGAVEEVIVGQFGTVLFTPLTQYVFLIFLCSVVHWHIHR